MTVADRVQQLRRDVLTVLRGLGGKNPPPLIERGPSRYRTQAGGTEEVARVLTVERVVKETPDATSLHLVDPAGRPLTFVPGQFFTVLVSIDGKTHRRAYSASSSHLERDRVRLTIKRVKGGLVSNHINDHARAGQPLRVLGPSGRFTWLPRPDGANHLVLLGGGSGITPLFAIAQAVLHGEPQSRVSLVYGNRRLEDVIFRDEIELLRARFPDRFTVRHVLAEPPGGWRGATGLLTPDVLDAEISRLPGDDGRERHYLVCGPEPMMESARQTLAARGVPADRILEERFFTRETPRRAAPTTGGEAVIRVGGREARVEVPAGTTLLEAALRAGLPMPYSCAMGGCGACRVRLVEGEVDLDEPNCLSDLERQRGEVLTCVGRPRGAVRLEVA